MCEMINMREDNISKYDYYSLLSIMTHQCKWDYIFFRQILFFIIFFKWAREKEIFNRITKVELQKSK